MSKRLCKNCEFWVPMGSLEGQCRRNAPVLIPCRTLGDAGSYFTAWPCTQEHNFCGEFTPKTSENGGPNV